MENFFVFSINFFFAQTTEKILILIFAIRNIIEQFKNNSIFTIIFKSMKFRYFLFNYEYIEISSIVRNNFDYNNVKVSKEG